MPHEHRSIAFKKPNDLGRPLHPSSLRTPLCMPSSAAPPRSLSLTQLFTTQCLLSARDRGPWPRLTRLFATAANSLCRSLPLSGLLPLINMCCITHTNIIFEPRRVSFRARHRFLRFDIIATRLRRTATAHAQRPEGQTGLVCSARGPAWSGDVGMDMELLGTWLKLQATTSTA